MSYEGYTQLLCERGHQTQRDCNDYLWNYTHEERKARSVCQINGCGRPFRFYCSVDETNGYDKRDPSTYPGKTKPHPIEPFDDEWQTDRHGNRYAVTHPLVSPDDPDRWLPIGPSQEQADESTV